jgi:hypothetical protein
MPQGRLGTEAKGKLTFSLVIEPLLLDDPAHRITSLQAKASDLSPNYYGYM